MKLLAVGVKSGYAFSLNAMDLISLRHSRGHVAILYFAREREVYASPGTAAAHDVGEAEELQRYPSHSICANGTAQVLMDYYTAYIYHKIRRQLFKNLHYIYNVLLKGERFDEYLTEGHHLKVFSLNACKYTLM